MEFFKKSWLRTLKSMIGLIHSMHIRCTIYDRNLPCNNEDKLVWPNVTMLIVSGFSIRSAIPYFYPVVAALPILEDLFIRNLFFNYNLMDHCSGKHLRNIVFENCSFVPDKMEKNIWLVVNDVKKKKNDFPLCIKFDCIKFLKTQQFTEYSTLNFNKTSHVCHTHINIMGNRQCGHEQRKKKIISWDESTYDIVKKVHS